MKIGRVVPKILKENKLLLLGVSVAILYWCIEAFADTLVSRSTFFERLFPADPHELWMRLTVVALVVAFSGYAQHLLGKHKRVEEEMHESRERLQAVLDNAATSVYIKDVAGRYLLVNRDVESVFGLTREHILGRTDHEILPQDVADALRKNDRTVLETGAYLSEEEELFKDGEKRTYITAKFPLRGPGGRPYAICGISTDITEHKRAEKRLRESEERFQTLTEASLEAIVIIEGERVLEVNRAYTAIFGYEPREIVGRSALEAVAPESHETVRAKIASGYEDPYEAVGLRKDSTRFDMEVHGRTLDYQGRTVRITAIRDVTERKRAEADLRASEAGLAEAQRVAHLGSWEAEPVRPGKPRTEHAMRWSDEMFRIFGFSPQEFEPTFGSLIASTHPEDRERVPRAIGGAISRGETSATVEHRAVRPDGEVRFVQAQVEMVLDESGNVTRNFGTVLDITERKRAEITLAESEKRYRALVEQTPGITYIEALDEDDGPDHTLLYVSPQVERVLGYSVADWQANPGLWEELLYPEDRERVLAEDARTEETGEPFRCEYRIVDRAGSVVWLWDEAVLVRDEEGRPLYWQGVQYDITERKEAEEELRRSEEMLRAAQRIARVGDWSFDVAGNRAHWSDEMYRIFGLAPQGDLTFRRFLARVHADDRKLVVEAARDALQGNSRSSLLDYRVVRPDGDVRHVHAQYEVERDASGRTTKLVGTLQDVTELRKTEADLRKSEERFRSLVQNSLDVVMLVDAEANILYYSPSVETVMGYKPEELVDKNSVEAVPVHPDDIVHVTDVFDYVIENPGVSYSMEMKRLHADGSWRTIEATAKNLLEDPSVGGVVVNYRDISERKDFEEQLSHQAFHDPLTDLPNRALLSDRLEHALARTDRGSEGVAVLFVDLDNFKVINDSLGHKTGDALLVAAARRLRQCLRPGYTVARLSGDEFIILLEDLSDRGDAIRLANRIAERMKEPFTLGGHEVVTTTSVGIVLGASGTDRPDDLLRKADIAMYRAKSAGKARYKVFDPGMEAEVHTRLRLERDLRHAVERKEFVLHYQVKLELNSNLQRQIRSTGSRAIVASAGESEPRIVDAEALVRWNHPHRGLVSPLEFIPLAEETGLIIPLGYWILKEACSQVRRWQEQFPDQPLHSVCVNLSAKQFHDPGLVRGIGEVLRDVGLAPGDLMLEITESVLMEDIEAATVTLRELKDLGVKLAVDDFGTGYSSLSYLKRFPVDFLKIDRSFVETLARDPVDKALVSAMINLAHALGMRVVAEGVETAEQLAQLRTMGCDVVQGYYFSRPLPGEAIPSLLSAAFADETPPL